MSTKQAETPESCLAGVNEACRMHPVDCPTCKNEKTCQQKDDMQKHPQIKSCPHHRRRTTLLEGMKT